MQILGVFQGVVSIEVFSFDDLKDSLELLDQLADKAGW
jgi:hypothetical protein